LCCFDHSATVLTLHPAQSYRLACNGDGVGNSLSAAKPIIDLDRIRITMHSILYSIATCHANQIIHRNVKPSKFLIVEETKECHMSSFTSSLMGGGSAMQRPLMPRMGTTQYLAPEVLLGAADLEFDYTTYTDKVDMWAAGLILAEMSAGGPLFVVDSEIDLLFSIFRMLGTPTNNTWPGVEDLACKITNFPSWPARETLEGIFPILGEQGCHLLSQMLKYDANTRYSAMEALQHPFFTQHGLPTFEYDLECIPVPFQNAMPVGQCAIWSELVKKQRAMPPTIDYVAKMATEPASPTPEEDPKITTRMRAILVDWLAEVSYSWCLRAERRALHAAVHCLDRFMSQRAIPKRRLQLVGATCYAVTAKLEEAEVISPSGYAHIADTAFTEEEMRDCEIEVAHVLGGRFLYATAPDFEPLLAQAMGLTPNGPVPTDGEIPQTLLLAMMLSDFMLLGYFPGSKSWEPSTVTAASFCCACVALNNTIPEVLLANADEETMLRCIEHVIFTYNQGIEWDLRNLTQNAKYTSIQTVPVPNATFICSKISEAYRAL